MHPRIPGLLLLLLLPLALAAAACSDGPRAGDDRTPAGTDLAAPAASPAREGGGAPGIGGAPRAASLLLTSPAFANGAAIPPAYTCDGEDVSPALAWTGVPEGARSLVLLVEDPDAPDPAAPRMTWAHWVLYDLPPDSRGLARAVPPSELPPGTRQGRNDWKRTGWDGPCPPTGRHRYFFRLFALDTVLGDLGKPARARLLEAMSGHTIARAELMGTYERAP